MKSQAFKCKQVLLAIMCALGLNICHVEYTFAWSEMINNILSIFITELKKIWENWPVLATILVPGYFAWRNLKIQNEENRKTSLEMFNLQKRKEDAQSNMPVVIEMLEDLGALQQAFIHRGIFIPGLEHRCPNIQMKDSKEKDELSIAERTHQLYLIALRIIRNSRKIIFLTPEGVMPKTVAVCKQIRDAFQLKEAGQRRYFEIKIADIATILQHGFQEVSQPQTREENHCEQFAAELEEYQNDLERHVQEEFPTYAKEACRR